MSTIKDLEHFLLTQGFLRYPQRASFGTAVLFQKRLHGVEPVCSLNDKLHLNATISVFQMAGGIEHQSVELDITGETPGGEAAKLSIYAVKPADVPGRRADYERRLVAAWQAVAEAEVGRSGGRVMSADTSAIDVEFDRIIARAKADPLYFGVSARPWRAERRRRVRTVRETIYVPKRTTLKTGAQRRVTDLAWGVFMASPILLYVSLNLVNWSAVAAPFLR